MANIKSAKKRAKQAIVKRQRNVARKTSVKTAIKKVLSAISNNESFEATKHFLQAAEEQIARAAGKSLFHKNTAQRKISRLAKRVANYQKTSVANA